MQKFWTSKEFKEKSQIWEKKLNESGFIDAEQGDFDRRILKESSMDPFIKKDEKNCLKTEITEQAKYAYFQILSEWVHKERFFDDELDRLIMERTAEGKTIKEISAELKSLLMDGKKRSKFNRDTIRYVRRRYENKWGIRAWKPEEMTSRKVKTPTR